MDWKKLKRHIPHRVQISKTAWYEIVYINDFKDGKTLGETRFEPKQIVILNGISPKLTVITYLHECAHAYSEEHGLGLTENQILAMEKGFYYLLKAGNIFVE